jgi:hypothetical protein
VAIPRAPRVSYIALGVLGAIVAAACAEGTDPLQEVLVPDIDASSSPHDAAVPPRPDLDSGVGPTDAASADATDATDACSAALASITFDFESGPAGWTHGASDAIPSPPPWPYDPWTQGAATAGTPCKSGKCFGAELGQNYAQCQRGFLLSPAIDLSACKGRSVALAFYHSYAFWTGSYNGQTWFDGGVVEVSGDGASWQVAQGTYPGTVKINPNRTASYECVQSTSFGVDGKSGYVGVQATAVRAELLLPAAAVTDKTRVRFSFASGVSSSTSSADGSRAATASGWRVDDIAFVAK